MKKSNYTRPIFCLVFGLLIVVACSKDETNETPIVEEEVGVNSIDWKRTFAVDMLWFRPSFIGETTSEGFIILGTQPHEPRIFRFNNQGDTLGHRTYWHFDKLSDFRRGNADDFFFLADNQLVNITERGDIKWEKTIRLSNFNVCSDGEIVGIDRGFIQSDTITRNVRIKKTISDTLLWNTEIEGIPFLNDIVESNGQEYVAIAAYGQVDGQNIGTLLKLNNEGTILWQNAYFGQLISTNDSGDLLLMQFGENDNEDAHHLHLICLDKDGNEQWRKTFSDVSLFYEGQHLMANGSNGWLAAFYTTTGYDHEATTDIKVINIDKNGTILSDKSYGKANFVEIERKMMGLTTTREGGYAISRVNSIESGSDSLRVELIKVKP